MSHRNAEHSVGNIQEEIYHPSAEPVFDNEDEEGLISQRPASETRDDCWTLPPAESSDVITASNNVQGSSWRLFREKYPFLLINVIVLLMSSSGRFHDPVLYQYLYQKFADSVFGNASGKTSSHPCMNYSASDPAAESIRHIQEKTSAMLLYLNLSNFCLGIFGCLMLGALSNTLSRQQLLAIPITGYLVKCVMILVVICWNLHLNWLFLGFAAEGVLGNMCGVFLGVFLYITDITPRDKTRTIGLSFVDGLKGFITAGLNVAVGHLIEKTGFLVPALMSVGCVIFSLFAVSLLPDRTPQQVISQVEPSSTCRWFKHLVSPFTESKASRVRKMVLIGGMALLLNLSTSVATSKVETLYLMNLPFCFNAMTLGLYLCGRQLAYNGFLIIGVPLLYKCLPGMNLGIIGAISALSGIILYCTSTTAVEIYHVIVLSMGETVPLNLLRGETSRLLGPEVQGPLLALFATLETIGNVTGISALAIYKATVATYKGLVWIVCGAVTSVSIVLLIIYQIIWRRHQLDCLAKQILLKFSGKIN